MFQALICFAAAYFKPQWAYHLAAKPNQLLGSAQLATNYRKDAQTGKTDQALPRGRRKGNNVPATGDGELFQGEDGTGRRVNHEIVAASVSDSCRRPRTR